MSYELNGVKDFAIRLIDRIPQQSRKPISTHTHWESNRRHLERKQAAFKSADPETIYAYAQALFNAADYLLKKTTEPTNDRLDIIDRHTNFLYDKLNSETTPISLPGVKAKAIKHEPTKRTSKKNIIVEKLEDLAIAIGESALEKIVKKSPAVEKFLVSDEFKDFEKYCDFLDSDPRGHRFFSLDLDLHKEKFKAMTTLILLLKMAHTMDDINKALETFAKPGAMTTENGKTFYKPSPYEVLNRGQNITTLVLGSIGLKNTTSAQRFNSLMKKAGQINIETQAASCASKQEDHPEAIKLAK